LNIFLLFNTVLRC